MTFEQTVVAIGLAIGLVARFVVPGRRPMNILLALALGAGGAYGGIVLAERFGLARHGDRSEYVIAAAGAAILLVLFVALFRKQS